MRSHISLAVSSCLYMADAISEKERRRRDFELACVEREGGGQQREEAAKPWIRAGMCGGEADAISEKERRSRGFELAWKKPPAFDGRLCL